MTEAPKWLVAGNWKMNGLKGDLGELASLAEKVGPELAGIVDVAICPPSTLVMAAAETANGSGVAIGGQDCHTATSGAFTGDVSAEMLVEAGAKYIIVGHSERRDAYSESDETVRAKAEAVLGAGADPIICVGETLAEREGGDTLDVISKQIAGSTPTTAKNGRLVIAYEPVWAIGTGLTPTLEQIEEVHTAIRAQLVAQFGVDGESIRILYGGSMKPDNAAEILKVRDVNGGLVGGASLKADSFFAIVTAVQGA